MHIRLTIYLALFTACIVAQNIVSDVENARDLYKEFKQKYNKNYAKNDDHKRFVIFKDNLKRAQKFQEEDEGTAKYGVTQFSDLTPEEFSSMYANALVDDRNKYVDDSMPNLNTPAPVSFDWRKHGAVGPVLNQGECRSSWAFSVIGNIEGQWFRKTGQLLSLSQQQLIDCDKKDHGCIRGWPLKSYEEIKHLGGLQLSSDYPYRSEQGLCKIDDKKFKAYLNNSLVLPKDESRQAMWLVLTGPLASVLNAEVLQHYQSGIIHPPSFKCRSVRQNSAVLIVGYGNAEGMPFWIVKNSWSESYGEQGYFRIYRGDGTCGINELVTSAVIY